MKIESTLTILTSERCFKQKPTGREVANVVEFIKLGIGGKIEHMTLSGLISRIEEGRIFFPSCSATGLIWLQTFFFDFDNSGRKHISKEKVLSALRRFGLEPNVVYDTYNNTKERNRFRLVYVLSDVIKNQKTADEIKWMFLEILEVYGVDKKVKTTSGVIFGGTNAEVLYDEFYSESRIRWTYKNVMNRIQKIKAYRAQSLMLPTAKGFSYALNVVDGPTYEKIKGKAKTTLRLLKKGSKPVDMNFDDDIANVNLCVLKAVYTLHCKGNTVCENHSLQEYSVGIASVAELLHQNLYADKSQKVKDVLDSYNRLVAVVGENELFYPMKNVLEGRRIHYGGRYFNWLKSYLFESVTSTEPMEHTHNLMIKGHAFANGNIYGELLAEQLLQSFLWSGELRKYVGISVKTLIERTPQFKCKLNGLRTANERNTYIARSLKAMEKVIYEASSFPTIHSAFDIVIPKVTTKHLDKRIELEFNSKLDASAFLRDMGY